MLASEIACALGPCMDYDAEDIDECLTLIATIRCFASTGDKFAFEVLPPVLTNDSEIVMGQQLWGGFCAPRTESSYICAPLPSFSDSKLIGACILPFKSIGYPVLIFENQTAKNISAVVYGIRTSTLECDFYKQRDGATQIEKKWKSVELAESQVRLLHMAGEYSKSLGIGGVPKYLIDGESASDLYLVRKGPIPFLHMRSAVGRAETSMIHGVVRSRFSGTQSDKTNVVSSLDDLLQHVADMEAPSDYSFETYFTSKIEVCETPLEDESFEELAKTIATLPSILHPVFAMVATGPGGDSAMDCLKKMLEEAKSNQESKHSKRVTTDVKGNMLSDLTASSPWMHTVENIGNLGGISQAFCVASCMFEPKHVGMAIRDVVHDADHSKPILTARATVYNLAKRVQDPACVMCIDLSATREVKTIRLVNSIVDYEIDVDCASRLLDCRWIHPIGVLQSGKETGNFFTITCKNILRPKLQVCTSISDGYNSEREHVVRSPQFNFTSIDSRISKVESIVEDFKQQAESSAQKKRQSEPSSSSSDGLNKLASANENWQSSKRDRAGEKVR